MIIQDESRLSRWLAYLLDPICDAQIQALTNYVLALMRNKKTPEEVLRLSLEEKLEIFLKHETKNFVAKVFELIRSGDYLVNDPPPFTPKEFGSKVFTQQVMDMEKRLATKSSEKKEGSSDDICDISDNSMNSMETVVAPIDSKVKENSSQQSIEMQLLKEDGEVSETLTPPPNKKFKKTDVGRKSRLRRSMSSSPSPQQKRPGTSRSRTRGRNLRTLRKTYRRRTRSPLSPRNQFLIGRKRSRSAPRRLRQSQSQGSPQSRSWSRSPTFLPKGIKKERKRSRSRSPSSSTMLRNLDERIHAAALKERSKNNSTLNSVVYKVGENRSEKGNRCRDFDEKGLCMRGELCPFDHGNDPVVLKDIVMPPRPPSPSPQLGYNQHQSMMNAYGPMMPQSAPVMGEYYPDHPGMDPAAWANHFCPRGYDPNGMFGPGGMQMPPPPMCQSQMSMGQQYSHSGEVIPVIGERPMPQQHPMHNQPIRGGGNIRGRGRGIRGRLGYDYNHIHLGLRTSRNHTNCCLEVKKIPRALNNIMDLSGYFSRFGRIVNIQVSFENDPEAALVTFGSAFDAQSAFRCTDAVLGNRFIRVFWHNKDKENEEGFGLDAETREKILLSGNNISRTVVNSIHLAADQKKKAVEAIKKNQEMLAAQSVQRREQVCKKETLKILRELRERKEAMLQEQFQQQKKLISKMENGKSSMKAEEKADLLSLIKSLQSAIEKLKKDLEESIPKIIKVEVQEPIPAPLTPKTKNQAQREMLDAELELYNKQQEGTDTLDLRIKIEELRSKVRSSAPPYSHVRGRGGSRSTFRGGAISFRGLRGLRGRRGRGRFASRRFSALRTVDRRSTKIIVRGFPQERMPEILPHFSQFGTITEYETNPNTPTMTIKFESRKSAELALANGKIFGTNLLEISWVSNEFTSSTATSSQNIETNISANAQIKVEVDEDNVDGDVDVDDDIDIEDTRSESTEPEDHKQQQEGDLLSTEILLSPEEDEDEENDQERSSWRR